MKKIVFSLVLSIAMIATAMAQEEKPMVIASANTTTTYETTESPSGGLGSERPYIKGARFNAYFDFGFSMGGYKRMVYTANGGIYDTEITLLGLQVFNPTLGVRIFDYGFIGIQIGLTDMELLLGKVYYGYGIERSNLLSQSYPIMVDMRGFIPINKDVHPYIEYAFGCSPEFICYENYWRYEYNDWFRKRRVGVGIDIHRLSLGLGWNCNWGYYPNGSVYKRDYFYMKIGVKIGRRE